MATRILFLCVVALFFSGNPVFANVIERLQDFCVADFDSSVKINGLICKNPNLVKANDFFFSGLTVVASITRSHGSIVIPLTAAQMPGLNTLGISMERIYFSPGGLNPPHIHPRASETITVTEGSILVGFVTSNPENRLFSKVLHRGDVFVFPIGLVHLQRSVGKGYAAAWASFNSQNPGTVTFGNATFGSNPGIADEVLAKAFQVDEDIVNQIQSKF